MSDLLPDWVIENTPQLKKPGLKTSKLKPWSIETCTDGINRTEIIINDYRWRGWQDHVTAWTCSFLSLSINDVRGVDIYHTNAVVISHSFVLFSIRHRHPSISSFSPPFYPSSPIIPPSSSSSSSPSPSASLQMKIERFKPEVVPSSLSLHLSQQYRPDPNVRWEMLQ